MRKYILACLLLFPLWLAAQMAYTVESVPNTRLQSNSIHISDPDNFIAAEYESLINQALCGIQEQADVYVVCLNSIGDTDVVSFGADLFNTWGIGDAQRNNGLLMLLVMDVHKFRFEVGYGLEEVMTDLVCRNITQNTIIPYFKQDLYAEGIYAGVCDVVEKFGGVMPSDSTLTQTQQSNLYSLAGNDTSTYENDDRGFFQMIWEDWFLNEKGNISLLGVIYILFTVGLIVFFFQRWCKKLKSKNQTQNDVERANTALKDDIGVTGALGCFFPLVWLLLPLFLLTKPILRRQRKKCVCGKTMHRLSEAEEDKYLNEEQQLEEDLKVRDYDVWLCDDCGRTSIFYYDLFNSKRYETCPKCQCKAGKKIKTETLVCANYEHGGTIQKTYICKHCKKEFTRRVNTPKLTHTTIVSSGSGGSFRGGGFGGGSFGGGHSGGGGFTGSW